MPTDGRSEFDLLMEKLLDRSKIYKLVNKHNKETLIMKPEQVENYLGDMWYNEVPDNVTLGDFLSSYFELTAVPEKVAKVLYKQ